MSTFASADSVAACSDVAALSASEAAFGLPFVERFLGQAHQVHGAAGHLERDVRGAFQRGLQRRGPRALVFGGRLRQLVRGHHGLVGLGVAIGQRQQRPPLVVALVGDGAHPFDDVLEALLLDREPGHHRDQRRAGGGGHGGPGTAARRRGVRGQILQIRADPGPRGRHVDDRDLRWWLRRRGRGPGPRAGTGIPRQIGKGRRRGLGLGRRPSLRRHPLVTHAASSISRSNTCVARSNPSSRTCAASSVDSAASGTSPTISESVTSSPRTPAAATTAS